MEGNSENQVKKRGRPRSPQRAYIEGPGRLYAAEGCLRTRVNDAYRTEFTVVVQKAPAEIQKLVWGHTEAEIMGASGGSFARGYRAMAESIGRWIAAGGDREQALKVVVDALKRGLSFRDISEHFRRLRLGERQGKALSLYRALCRTVDDYRKRFPKTTNQQTITAVQSLLEGLESAQAELIFSSHCVRS
jgi:hypothetical protein